MRAELRVELRTSGGRLVASRDAKNAVLRGGADILARLFAGQGTGITHMAIGTSDAPEGDTFGTTALAGAVEIPIAADAFQIDPPDPVKRVVRVRVRATVPASQVMADPVREAALVARADATTATLYNRVVFAPIQKTADHELTLFWEVGFPYGDLQWLL
jgi:hypothetical protein